MMRPIIVIIFFLCLLQCTDSNACDDPHESHYAKKKRYSWDFDLDYEDDQYDYNKKEEQVEPNRPHEDLVVTICDYNNDGELYCYDLP